MPYVPIGIGILIILIVFWAIKAYNKLVMLRNSVLDQWSQIDVQLKRRFDLMPNLVETVAGYAKHENETLLAVTNARNNALNAKTPRDEIKANGELTNALTKLFAVAESYPDLKANVNFMDLQSNLKETENKISFARQFYNDTVLKYKNAAETFPTSLIAGLFRFKPEEFYRIDNESDRANPQVRFG